MKKWLNYAALYHQPRMLGILMLGFSSGLPFLLTLGTLHAWLKVSGASNTAIGFFALATIPYAFKFLWAPLTDHIHIPFLTNTFGQRRSWILLSQVGLVLALILLGSTDPAHNLYPTAAAAFLVTICASCQDNAIEAYRIELLPQNQIGHGASASVMGFRVGMWVSGGGALYLAYAFENWFVVYFIMSLCVIGGMIATLLLPEPQHEPHHEDIKTASFGYKFKKIIIPTFIEFTKRKDIGYIIIFIVLFKIGDTVLNMISIPFLLEIGFTKLDIANIAKTFGIVAMIAGGLFGGMLQAHKPSLYTLAVSASLLVVSSMMFMFQAYIGYDTRFLILTMGIENFACGMSATALIAYLSTLCHRPHTATHFAILSSFCSLSRVSLSMGAGWLADKTDWITYFAIIGSLSLLALVWLIAFGQQIASVYRKPILLTHPS